MTPDDDGDVRILRRGQHHDGALPLDAQRIHHGAQLFAIHAGNLGGQNLDALDVLARRFRARTTWARASFSFICSICFSSARFSSSSFSCACSRGLRAFSLNFSSTLLAGDGLDAPDSGRNAAFVGDHAEPDVAGAMDVRAAAQFLAEAGDGDHTHFIAVFLAEQRHGAGVERLIEIHDVGRDFDILQDLFVHQLLNFRQLVGIGVGVMREVETQAAGIHDAAGLLDVRARAPCAARRAAGAWRCDCAWWRGADPHSLGRSRHRRLQAIRRIVRFVNGDSRRRGKGAIHVERLSPVSFEMRTPVSPTWPPASA